MIEAKSQRISDLPDAQLSHKLIMHPVGVTEPPFTPLRISRRLTSPSPGSLAAGNTTNKARSVDNFRKDQLRAFCTWTIWPLKAPDMNPCDYGIWRAILKVGPVQPLTQAMLSEGLSGVGVTYCRRESTSHL